MPNMKRIKRQKSVLLMGAWVFTLLSPIYSILVGATFNHTTRSIPMSTLTNISTLINLETRANFDNVTKSSKDFVLNTMPNFNTSASFLQIHEVRPTSTLNQTQPTSDQRIDFDFDRKNKNLRNKLESNNRNTVEVNAYSRLSLKPLSFNILSTDSSKAKISGDINLEKSIPNTRFLIQENEHPKLYDKQVAAKATSELETARESKSSTTLFESANDSNADENTQQSSLFLNPHNQSTQLPSRKENTTCVPNEFGFIDVNCSKNNPEPKKDSKTIVDNFSTQFYKYFAKSNESLQDLKLPLQNITPVSVNETTRESDKVKRHERFTTNFENVFSQDVQPKESNELASFVSVNKSSFSGNPKNIFLRSHSFEINPDNVDDNPSIRTVVSTENPEEIVAQQAKLADVISRGRIDSVMYVYFGDKIDDFHTGEIVGRVIQAVGGIVAAVAQVLTLLGAVKCVQKGATSQILPIHIHIGFALLLSNLLLLLAVHATDPVDICTTVALILHYLNLVIGCWLFTYTVQTYRELNRHVALPPDYDEQTLTVEHNASAEESYQRIAKGSGKINVLLYCLAAWCAPIPFVMISYLANPDGYETRRYCWLSIEKGMVVSFIVPVFLLIGMNTFFVVMSLRLLLALRKLWDNTSENFSQLVNECNLDERLIENGIRASAMLLPLLAVTWFLEVVALENATSIFFQLTAAIAKITLSWLVMYFLGNEVWPKLCSQSNEPKPFLPSASSVASLDDPCEGSSSVHPSAAEYSFDDEPLLGGFSITDEGGDSGSSLSSRHPSMSNPRRNLSIGTSPSTSASAVSVSSLVSFETGLSGPSACGTFKCNMKKATSTKGYTTDRNLNTTVLTSPLLQQRSKVGPVSTRKKGLMKGSTNATNGFDGGFLLKSNPNWSRPGGNEIHELKLDSISTICE